MTPFGYRVLGFGAASEGQTYTPVAESIPLGARSALFAGTYANGVKADADPNTINKFIVAYAETGWTTSPTNHCVVGTLGSDAVTYATPVSVGAKGNDWLDIKYTPHTAGKFVFAYTDVDNSHYGTAVVGTVSGDSITYGTPVVYASAMCQYQSIAMDFNTTDKFVISFRDMNDNSYGKAIVGTISGTSLTFGTEATYSGTSAVGTNSSMLAYDRKTADKVLLAYQDVGNSNYGTAIVGTVSGTDISFGTAAVFETQWTYTHANCLTGDPFNANKFFMNFTGDQTDNYPKICVCTVSGTDVSFGTTNIYESYAVTVYSIDADTNTENKFAIAGHGSAARSSEGVIYVASVDGTTMSIESGEHTFGGSQGNNHMSLCFDHDPSNAGKFSVTYADQRSDGLHLPAGYLGAGYAGQIASQTPDD